MLNFWIEIIVNYAVTGVRLVALSIEVTYSQQRAARCVHTHEYWESLPVYCSSHVTDRTNCKTAEINRNSGTTEMRRHT
jgi:hypothetical protein